MVNPGSNVSLITTHKHGDNDWQVENGANVNAADHGGSTALHVAVKRGHVPLAAALVRRGGDITVLDRHGRSPLDFVNREQDVEDIAVGHFKAAERNPMLVQ